MNNSIIEQNRETEAFVIQAGATRSFFFKDEFKPLTFVHLADMGNQRIEVWNRMVEYINYYKDYISFAIHTGDYCGSSQLDYTDYYNDGTPCERPILNCVGNHDREENNDWANKGHSTWAPQSAAHALLFNRTENWDVNFMPGETPTAYYKDFPESNIRLIVLDLYYEQEAQKPWLASLLAEAKEKGMHVITAMHETTDTLPHRLETTFDTYSKFEERFGVWPKSIFEDIIADFIDAGGQFVCNFAGHRHNDYIGYTARGVLNVAIECAGPWYLWTDARRIRGTRTDDCFNVVGIDTNLGLLKLIRIGNNCDCYMRRKTALCYDYINKKMIFTD